MTMPVLHGLEEGAALDLLFRLRGHRSPPPQVAVVSIDRASSAKLGLPKHARDWSRTQHATLVDKLTLLGAKVIVFDVEFTTVRDPQGTRAFAEAMKRAGNVVLFERLELRHPEGVSHPPDPRQQSVHIEQRIGPLPLLAEAAVATAPFPLPKLPIKISQSWLFKAGAGDAATLPAVAFQIYAGAATAKLLAVLDALDARAGVRLRRVLDELGPRPGEQAKADALRAFFHARPQLARALGEALESAPAQRDHGSRRLARTLLGLYAGEARPYLDFYGPPLSINTVPYHLVVTGASNAVERARLETLAGKAVFVGFSTNVQQDQPDAFYTVYTQADGLNVSGVEIAATAFANLVEGRSVRPVAPALRAGVVALWGLFLGIAFLTLSGLVLIPVATILALLYCAAVYHGFAAQGVWLPSAIPLLIQLPAALLGGLLWQYRDSRRQRQEIRNAFGYYLPHHALDELLSSKHGITDTGGLVYGICLATDVRDYASLSEALEPDELKSLMNRYFDVLFEPVHRGGGYVSDVVGDAMLAMWTSAVPDAALRVQACNAALEIHAKLDAFKAHGSGLCMPTRIGLHCGRVAVGNVGAGSHYEYRAVGDMVNVASRIEGLNKQLGTRLLATGDVVGELDDVVSRELGTFRVAGRNRPLTIHEVVASGADIAPSRRSELGMFADALGLFQGERWHEARVAFSRILEHYQDGPSLFYRDLCARLATQPPADWDGVVTLTRK